MRCPMSAAEVFQKQTVRQQIAKNDVIHHQYTFTIIHKDSELFTGCFQYHKSTCLSCFKQHNCLVTQIKEYKVLRFVSYERTEVSSYYAVPVRGPSRIKFILYSFSTTET